MKSKIAFLISLIIATAFLVLGISAVFQEKAKTDNLTLSNLYQPVNYENNLAGNDILKGGAVNFEFKAKYNNLGQIQFLFDNHNRINSDVLIFYIKEKGSNNWYSQNYHDTSKMDIGQFYPFGFLPIKDSKDKTYEVRIVSRDGIPGNSVSLSGTVNQYQLVYYFPLSFLKQNVRFVPLFMYQKLENYVALLNIDDLIFLTLCLVASVIVIFPVISFVRRFSSFTKFELYLKNVLIQNCGIFLLIFFYALSHIQFLTYSQYWDAKLYYSAIVNASTKLPDLSHFLQNINIWGHASMGYVTLMGISQLIQNNNVYLLNTENLILAMCAIWAFYKIFLFFFNNRKLEAILTTAIFAFNPLFYATSISLSLDFPVLVFEVLAFSAFLYKKYFSFFFWSVLLIFSKETGLLIYGSFIAGYFLLYEVKRLFSGFLKFDYKKYIIFIIPMFLFGLFLFSNHWQFWTARQSFLDISGSPSFIWNDNGLFGFGINSTNIAARTVQMFIMNFSWLFSLIVLASVVKCQIFGEDLLRNLSDKKKDLVRIFTFVMIIFIIFNFIYIVMSFSRYVVENVFFFTIISYVCLDYLFFRSKKLRTIILLVIAVLFIIQTFKALDPSVQILYGTRDTTKDSPSALWGAADGLVYNAQFAYIDKLSEMIINNSRGSFLIRQDLDVYFFEKISFQAKVSDIARMQNIKTANIIYVYVPWFSDRETDLDKLKKYYNVKYFKTLSVGGYYAELYRLEK